MFNKLLHCFSDVDDDWNDCSMQRDVFYNNNSGSGGNNFYSIIVHYLPHLFASQKEVTLQMIVQYCKSSFIFSYFTLLLYLILRIKNNL